VRIRVTFGNGDQADYDVRAVEIQTTDFVRIQSDGYSIRIEATDA
jgi:hypothetical protein